MSSILSAVISFSIAILPIKLAAWTCICGYTDEKKQKLHIGKDFPKS